MGCDIHMFSEFYSESKKSWLNFDYWIYNEHYEGGENGEDKMHVVPIWSNRNYTLFTVLAGVRDYYEKTACISPPKGIPEDVCQIIKEESDGWGNDGHSHSYLTLKELKEFNKNKVKITYSGLVSKEDAEKLDKGEGFPQSWCQWASQGLNFVYREWEEEVDVLSPPINILEERMRDKFWLFDKNKEYPEYEEKVRIVFWFDN